MVSYIDIAIVIAYMFFCLVIGLLRYGKIKNIRDYTLGTKPFSTVVLMVTTFATATSARQIIGHTGKVYVLGLVYMLPLFFTPISWFIFAKIFAPNLQEFRQHKFISLSDIMEHWYGITGRWVTNIISILLTIAITAVSVIAIGYLLHYFLNIPKNLGMYIGLIVVTSYSVFGGITSVAFTDLFQALIFFVALPLACFVGIRNISEVATIGEIERILVALPQTHKQININNLPLFLSFVFYALIPYTAIPYIQRALIAKNEKQFMRSFVGVAILTIPILLMVCLISLITYYSNPNIESNTVLYYFVDYSLPIGLKGLMAAGFLAIIMSTQDSYLNTISVLISHDICKQMWSSLTDKQELLIARISCVAISLIAITLIFMNRSVMDTIWLVGNFLEPLVAMPLIAGLVGVRINKNSFIFMIIASISTIIVTRIFTGVFDTRSLAIGMVTSAIALYILHKKHKRESIFSLPKVNISLLSDKLNKRVLNNSYSIGSLYTVGVVLCINFLVGVFCANLNFFNPLNVSLVVMA
ncbi:MAG: sodium:solute symporter family protein, partial [Rickettsiales bacterium]|nr:sodium:solute symporter family protein [Rickettsiales bacterium]